jgi:hypothetical protein
MYRSYWIHFLLHNDVDIRTKILPQQVWAALQFEFDATMAAGFAPSTVITTPAQFLDAYESIDVIGNGSFGIIRKVRRKEDGAVCLSSQRIACCDR